MARSPAMESSRKLGEAGVRDTILLFVLGTRCFHGYPVFPFDRIVSGKRWRGQEAIS